MSKKESQDLIEKESASRHDENIIGCKYLEIIGVVSSALVSIVAASSLFQRLKFNKRVEWPASETYAIRKIFERKASKSLTDKLFYARDKEKRPNWIGDAIWIELQAKWESENYQKKRATNRKNRASDCDGQGFPLHKGGSISHLEHKDRLEAQLGRTVGLAESFRHTHSSQNKETGELRWVDERARNTYFDFESKWNELSDQNSNPDGEGGEGCPSSMPDEVQVWIDTVGGAKKGRLYGAPGHASRASSSSSWSASSGMYNQQLLTRIDAQQQEINTVRAENDGLKTELTGVKSKLSSMESKLDQMMSMTQFFSHGFHNMQAPGPSGTDIRPSAYVPPPGYPFMPTPGFYPPYSNVSPPARSSSPPEDNDED